MVVRAYVLPGRYVDSVVLMNVAAALSALDGIEDAAAMMATAANKDVLERGGFDSDAVQSACSDDLVIAVKASDDAVARCALAQVDGLLATPPTPNGSSLPVPRTLGEALAADAELNLAAISLPGEYAAAEAHAALEHGLHVFLFSSNVALEDEIELKRLAAERGLLCMGPDCGTALIAGKGLGFANAARRGSVGIVGASGTGIQALMCFLDSAGVGVSHALGCGSRDLSDEVGAKTANAALDALLADAETRAIVIVSKPPSPAVADSLRRRAERASKPVICCFLGDDAGPATLDEAARMAIAAVGSTMSLEFPLPSGPIEQVKNRLGLGQRFIRGLYAGGTLAYEAQLVLRAAGLDVASNAPLPGNPALTANGPETGHIILDLGAEDFTRGRPHPMIDARVRRQRLHEEAANPDVAVVLLDFVLGFGAASDPAGDLARDIAEARAEAADQGRELAVLAYVCGTVGDPQGLGRQTQTLRDAGALVLPTNAAAARAAARIVADVGSLVGGAK
jgi:FdrA protein